MERRLDAGLPYSTLRAMWAAMRGA
jgi:hypothetical protein